MSCTMMRSVRRPSGWGAAEQLCAKAQRKSTRSLAPPLARRAAGHAHVHANAPALDFIFGCSAAHTRTACHGSLVASHGAPRGPRGPPAVPQGHAHHRILPARPVEEYQYALLRYINYSRNAFKSDLRVELRV